jgi:hypothetical protein|tara:strand:+ start:4408 stop:4647 length:240 start_codon:yes stop_codon:yes gene_type:complete
MKNWKDKVLGILAGIGLMTLLIGSTSSQSQNGKWMITLGVSQNNEIILKMDTQTGQVYRWDKKGLKRFEGTWVNFIEIK